MKKRFFCIIAAALIMSALATTFISCSKDEDNPEEGTLPYADYLGIWKAENNDYWETLTLSKNKLVFLDSDGGGYTIENLSWTAITNPSGNYTVEYPTGYKITGKLTAWNDYVPNKADGSHGEVGDTVLDWWYISTDKGSLRWTLWSSLEHSAADWGPYIKQ